MTKQSMPNIRPRRILVAVTGLSPQVVTETLYALAVAATTRWMPERICLITTAKGANQAQLSLLGPDGQLGRLIADYDLPPVVFDEDDILVLRDEAGRPLDDIRTPEDNERAGDFILEQVRLLTEQPATELHVSIAGGRKTMGFYLGYALSLYGRPQDRLSHVLVSAPFESHWDFFYPPPAKTDAPAIQLADGTLADPRTARIMLAEIPFVRMRHGLDERLTSGRASFSEAVASAQAAVDPGRLVIDLEGKRILAGGTEVRLPPAELAFLSWLARRKKEGKGPVNCPPEGVSEEDYAREYLREYEEIADPRAKGTAARLRDGMDKNFFVQTKSHLFGSLKKALGPAGAVSYGVVGEGKPKRYEVAVAAGDIEWREIA